MSPHAIERWLAARDAEAVRTAWTALAPRRHSITHGGTVTLLGAARLAEAILGEPADWIANVFARPPEVESRGEVAACFLEAAWDVNERCHQIWAVHEPRDAGRRVQVVMVGLGSIGGRPEGSSEIVVRIVDGDRAASMRIGAKQVALIGTFDLAVLDVLLVEHRSAPVTPDVVVEPRSVARASAIEGVWEWDAEGAFNPRFDATASGRGLAYGCEIQGPCCGYDSMGTQSWAEFLAAGPPSSIQMPPAIAAAIRAYATETRDRTP